MLSHGWRAGPDQFDELAAVLHEAGTEGRFKPRDLLLITDRREADNARNIAMDAGERGVEIWIAPEAGHGVELVPQPEVQERLLGWLDERLR